MRRKGEKEKERKGEDHRTLRLSKGMTRRIIRKGEEKKARREDEGKGRQPRTLRLSKGMTSRIIRKGEEKKESEKGRKGEWEITSYPEALEGYD